MKQNNIIGGKPLQITEPLNDFTVWAIYSIIFSNTKEDYIRTFKIWLQKTLNLGWR